MKSFSQKIAALTEQELEAFQAHGELTIEDQVFGEQDILLYRQAKEGTHAVSDRFISLDIDPQLTDALIAEGAVREVVSHVQKLRRERDFQVTDTIRLEIYTSENLVGWIQTHQDYLEGETLTQELVFCPDEMDNSVAFETELGRVYIQVATL